MAPWSVALVVAGAVAVVAGGVVGALVFSGKLAFSSFGAKSHALYGTDRFIGAHDMQALMADDAEMGEIAPRVEENPGLGLASVFGVGGIGGVYMSPVLAQQPAEIASEVASSSYTTSASYLSSGRSDDGDGSTGGGAITLSEAMNVLKQFEVCLLYSVFYGGE